jgi:hypothetical protein
VTGRRREYRQLGARDFRSEELCVPYHRHNLVGGAGDNRDRDVDKGKTVGQESVC